MSAPTPDPPTPDPPTSGPATSEPATPEPTHPAFAAALPVLMGTALDEAALAAADGDVPVGAVVARLSDGDVVARAHNERERTADPTAHAEVLALRRAAEAIGSWRLGDCGLVVTLEPCAMCAGAAVSARIGLVAFGASDPKAGALGSLYHLGVDPRLNHEFPVVPGVRADECAEVLEAFFRARRAP
ncbi:MAG TPA: nucleoside deaminase [Acidimicrobiia bacterium]|nr:nucleoside deaminase [Acidimicrobiia bacterium]